MVLDYQCVSLLLDGDGVGARQTCLTVVYGFIVAVLMSQQSSKSNMCSSSELWVRVGLCGCHWGNYQLALGGELDEK